MLGASEGKKMRQTVALDDGIVKGVGDLESIE
jgi:hypothetical protein